MRDTFAANAIRPAAALNLARIRPAQPIDRQRMFCPCACGSVHALLVASSCKSVACRPASHRSRDKARRRGREPAHYKGSRTHGQSLATRPINEKLCGDDTRVATPLTRISHRTGFLREGGEVQVTESRRDRRLSVAGGRKTACNATKRRIPTSVGILCLLRQAS